MFDGVIEHNMTLGFKLEFRPETMRMNENKIPTPNSLPATTRKNRIRITEQQWKNKKKK